MILAKGSVDLDYSYLDKNLELIKNKIQTAADNCGRDSAQILLMPAVKYADAEQINYLHTQLGVNDIGENRVQQLLEHWEKLERDGLRVHFIGSLQTNKVKYIIKYTINKILQKLHGGVKVYRSKCRCLLLPPQTNRSGCIGWLLWFLP